jgi:hypothetical protein
LTENFRFYRHAHETRFYGVTGAKIAHSFAVVVQPVVEKVMAESVYHGTIHRRNE